MAAAENILGLASELEQIEVRQWLRDQGLSDTVSAVDFAVWCLEQEGLTNVTQDLANEVLWNCTGFPSFWRIGVDGRNPIECCHTQLRGFGKVAALSKEHAGRLMSDPTYSWRQALADIDAQSAAVTASLLEDD